MVRLALCLGGMRMNGMHERKEDLKKCLVSCFEGA